MQLWIKETQIDQIWLVKNHRSFSLNNTLDSSISVKVNSNQRKTLLENNQHYTKRHMANTFKILNKTSKIICTSLAICFDVG